MATIDDTYNGWTNRETWAVALHVNNDQGWQESILDTLGSVGYGPVVDEVNAREAGEIIKGSVEDALNPDPTEFGGDYGYQVVSSMAAVAQDIGSLWRVNWDELGAAFLADLAEQ